MNARNPNPAYRREFSIKQNNSALYFWLNHVKPDLIGHLEGQLDTAKPMLPAVLSYRGRQVGRAMSRAEQASRRVAVIEKFLKRRARGFNAKSGKDVPWEFTMTDSEFQRYAYVKQASDRADRTVDQLIKSLREEVERMRAGGQTDLVAAMAAPSEDSPAEDPPPGGEPPEEEPPDDEPLIKEPGQPAPMKSA